jgi:acetyl-CoA acetyltransferase
MTDVVAVGSGMTKFGRFPDRTVGDLAREAVAGALDDAGLVPADVGMVFFGNAVAGLITGQEMVRGQTSLRGSGITAPVINVENACATSSSAFYLACQAVASGSIDVALAVGAEKLTHPDKSVSISAIGTAVDVGRVEWHKSTGQGLHDDWTAESHIALNPDSPSPFMDVYAHVGRQYMDRTGACAEDLAAVVVKNHRHGALNPKAQYDNLVTVDDVLTSRMIVPPLTVLMCSPIGDGAAAIVVCSAERARTLAAPPVRVLTCALVAGSDDQQEDVVQRAAAQAYHNAGVGPDDLDVVELHDAAATAELELYEQLQLCPEGGGAKLLQSGEVELGGRRPVNPSGGLLSRGHPIGATGCAQLVELMDQLRGRCTGRQVPGARIALAENAGGYVGRDHAAGVVTILARID